MTSLNHNLNLPAGQQSARWLNRVIRYRLIPDKPERRARTAGHSDRCGFVELIREVQTAPPQIGASEQMQVTLAINNNQNGYMENNAMPDAH